MQLAEVEMMSLKMMMGMVSALIMSAAAMSTSTLSQQMKNSPFNIVLPYYSHYYVGENIIQEIPPNNSSSPLGFGLVQAMDLPATATPDPESTLLGAERCLAAVVHDDPSSYIGNMHVCTITYNDGTYNGIFSIHGESNLADLGSGWEFAVTGGTRDFRGAQGYVTGSVYPSNSTSHFIYYYVAHIHLPTAAYHKI